MLKAPPNRCWSAYHRLTPDCPRSVPNVTSYMGQCWSGSPSVPLSGTKRTFGRPNEIWAAWIGEITYRRSCARACGATVLVLQKALGVRRGPAISLEKWKCRPAAVRSAGILDASRPCSISSAVRSVKIHLGLNAAGASLQTCLTPDGKIYRSCETRMHEQSKLGGPPPRYQP